MILYRSGFKWVAMLLIAAVAAVGAPPAYAKSPVVTGVQVTGARGKLYVHVAATGEVQYKVLNLNDPRFQLVVEISPAQLSTDVPKSVDVDGGPVEKVRVGQFSDNPAVVRLVFDLKTPVKYQIGFANGHKGLQVAVSLGDDVSAKASTAGTSSSTSASGPAAAGSTSTPVVTRYPSATAAKPVLKVQRVASDTETDAQPDVNPEGSHSYTVHSRQSSEVAWRKPGGRRGGGGRRRSGGGGSHMVSLDFVSAGIVPVLKILCKELGLNLVTDQTVSGSVTMSLKNVPAAGALQLIIKMAKLESKVVDHTIIVGSADTIANIPSNIFSDADKTVRSHGPDVTLPIPLEHAKASGVADQVKTFFTDLTKVSADTTNNFVVVVGQASRMKDVKEFIQKIDVPPAPPVVPKTEIVPIKYATVQTVLSLSKTLFPSLSFAVEDRLNALVIVGTDSEIERFKTFLATIDTPLPQVMLDIRVVALSEDASKTLGFTIGSSSGNFGVFAGTGGSPITFTEALPLGASSTQSLAISPFTRTPFVLGATLSMLIARNDAKVISTPRIMTQSNQSAQVLIGDKFPIVYFDPRAGQFQVQYVDIGVKLVVKPVVSADGFVTCELAPEVSVLEGLINNQYPRTSITTIKSMVRVRDGDTIIVGGLVKETESYTLQKLPLLGDLPILGNFFKNTSVSRTKQEVFITITPKIIP